jgi:hypothetical protein
MIATDDLVPFVDYARENDLLNTDGWKQFQRLAKSEKTQKESLIMSN